MAALECTIPTNLLSRLDARVAATGKSLSEVVTDALSHSLDESAHGVFQVSVSGALVAGLYPGVITTEALLEHGDFGLGTFENLDGEMVVLEGRAYRIRRNGEVSETRADDAVAFAVVASFVPELDVELSSAASLDALTARCDEYRPSNNIFYAFRLDGLFPYVRTRAVSEPADGGRLIDAAKAQAEFELREIRGTLAGFWSPAFSRPFGIPGYHFHFLSDDRMHGGHLLECSSGALRLRMKALTDVHLALPDQESFLEADLTKNADDELARAEHAH